MDASYSLVSDLKLQSEINIQDVAETRCSLKSRIKNSPPSTVLPFLRQDDKFTLAAARLLVALNVVDVMVAI